jgi:hypothetical protein
MFNLYKTVVLEDNIEKRKEYVTAYLTHVVTKNRMAYIKENQDWRYIERTYEAQAISKMLLTELIYDESFKNVKMLIETHNIDILLDLFKSKTSLAYNMVLQIFTNNLNERIELYEKYKSKKTIRKIDDLIYKLGRDNPLEGEIWLTDEERVQERINQAAQDKRDYYEEEMLYFSNKSIKT